VCTVAREFDSRASREPGRRTRRADAHALARKRADDARHAAMFKGKNAADGKVRPAGRPTARARSHSRMR